MLKPQNG